MDINKSQSSSNRFSARRGFIRCLSEFQMPSISNTICAMEWRARPRHYRPQSLADVGSTVPMSVVRGTIPSPLSFVCEGAYATPADATTIPQFAVEVMAVSSTKCYRG